MKIVSLLILFSFLQSIDRTSYLGEFVNGRDVKTVGMEEGVLSTSQDIAGCSRSWQNEKINNVLQKSVVYRHNCSAERVLMAGRLFRSCRGLATSGSACACVCSVCVRLRVLCVCELQAAWHMRTDQVWRSYLSDRPAIL